MRALVSAAAILMLLAGCVATGPKASEGEWYESRRQPTADRLPPSRHWVREAFMEGVFTLEATNEEMRLSRFTGDVTIRVTGGAAAAWVEAVERIAAQIAPLTGLRITVSHDEGFAAMPSANEIVVYISDSEVFAPSYLGATGIRGDTSGDGVCFVLTSDGLLENAAYVGVNARVLSDLATRSCLLEEIFQSFGFLGDVVIPGTLLFDGVVYGGMSPLDKVLLRALYDPRLRVGMTRAEMEPIIDAILSEKIEEMTRGASR